MLERLKRKWEVNGIRLVLILVTFAVGGSLTGYAGRKLVDLLAIDQKWLWIIIYVLLITLIWPLAVIIVSIFTGQFRFFLHYIKKIGVRMWLVNRENSPHVAPPIRIAIFASGAGSNAQKIIDRFRDNKLVKISLIVCNKPEAGVLRIALNEQVPSLIIEKERFFRGDGYLEDLKSKNIDLIVLAGFLWKLPATIINKYTDRIINIHPALLPKYGGKGMYGNHVHAAVIAAGEKESGITIHYVDEHYDNGDVIKQVRCPVLPQDTPDSLAQRIHQLEHEHYPTVIGELAAKLVR